MRRVRPVPSPNQIFGLQRERLAEVYLEARGYVVEARNWRGGNGEVDLVAWDGEVLCFVEVRSRSREDFGLPMETVDRRKQRKLVRAAMAYLTAFPPALVPMARFDVVSILATEPPVLELIVNAFDAGQ